MTFHILVVCTGNICRSPMGEIVLRKYLAAAGLSEVEVSSAGVSSEESGNPIDWRAQRVLAENGYELPDNHCAHRVTAAEMQQADLILAMTRGHAAALQRFAEKYGVEKEKIKLWQEFTGEISSHNSASFDVADPWYGDAAGFLDTLQSIEKGAAGITAYLKSHNCQ